MDTQALAIDIPQDSAQREQAKTLVSQSSHGRDLTAFFISCCLRVQLLISLHLNAKRNLPWSPKEQVGTSPTFSLWLTPTIKPICQYLPEKSLFTYLTPEFLWLPFKE